MKEKMLAKVQAGEMSSQDLTQLRLNIQGREDVEDLEDAIELQLRKRFPKAAIEIYGKKDHEARQRLEAALADFGHKHDLTRNQQGPGVKTGGDQRSGKKYVCQYISYRNADGSVAQLAVEQDMPTSEMYASVQRYVVRSGQQRTTERFALGDWPRARDAYEAALTELLR